MANRVTGRVLWEWHSATYVGSRPYDYDRAWRNTDREEVAAFDALAEWVNALLDEQLGSRSFPTFFSAGTNLPALGPIIGEPPNQHYHVGLSAKFCAFCTKEVMPSAEGTLRRTIARPAVGNSADGGRAIMVYGHTCGPDCEICTHTRACRAHQGACICGPVTK